MNVRGQTDRTAIELIMWGSLRLAPITAARGYAITLAGIVSFINSKATIYGGAVHIMLLDEWPID